MTPDDTTTTTFSPPAPHQAPAPQAWAAGSASASQAPAAQPAPPTPVQIFWDVVKLALGLLVQLFHVLKPVQSRYPKQSWQVARLYADLPRILLTLRFAPERVTTAQLRHLTRARHILQALFNYPLGARTPSSATPANTSSPSPDSPSPTPPGARKPSSATSTIRQVPEIPLVAGVAHVPATPASFLVSGSATLNPASHTLNPSPAFPDSHTSHHPHSSFFPYIPDAQTLTQALKADSLPPNCAGALLDEPGKALVRALRQLHAVYFSLYPTQSPSPSPSPSQSEMESPSPSSGNPQSSFSNPQSDAPSVHPFHSVHNVNDVNAVNDVINVHSPSPAQSEISNLKSEIRIPQSSASHSASASLSPALHRQLFTPIRAPA